MVRVAELLGESVLLDTPYFYQSLALINNYANSDRAMRFTGEIAHCVSSSWLYSYRCIGAALLKCVYSVCTLINPIKMSLLDKQYIV